MRLTARDLRVVTDVVEWQVLTRAQLAALGHFSSKTRSNAVLLRLVRFQYLSRRYQPAVAGTQRALYFPGPYTADLLHRPTEAIARERRRVSTLSDLFLAHQLLVNDIRLQFVGRGLPRATGWLDDRAVRALKLGVVPDAYAEYGGEGARFGAFIEADRGTETLTRWDAKVRLYLQLASSGRHRAALNRHYFRVLVICPSRSRLANLRRATAQLTDRLFWFSDLSHLQVEGPFARIWLRVLGAEHHELTEP
jgi:hypothetical protein